MPISWWVNDNCKFASAKEVLFEDEFCKVELVTPEATGILRSLPAKFIHFTDSIEAAKAIYDGGYDLSMFGATGQKYNVSPELTQWDPKGMYTLEYEEGMEQNAPRPWVLFEKEISQAVMMTDKKYERGKCGKAKLSELFGGAVGPDLQRALMDAGIDAVVSAGGEQVILDPGSAKPIAYGPAAGQSLEAWTSRNCKFADHESPVEDAPQQPVPEGPQAGKGAPSGAVGMNIGFQNHHLDSYRGQHYMKLYAYDADTPEWDVVGFLDYSDYEGKFYIDNVFVNPEFRRRGVGTALMRELERIAAEEGAVIEHGMRTEEGEALYQSMSPEKN